MQSPTDQIRLLPARDVAERIGLARHQVSVRVALTVAAMALGIVVLGTVALAAELANNTWAPHRKRAATANPLPATLRETGLYADAAMEVVAPDHLPYTPQYPLWSDGARKRRWIYLPPGTAIDGSSGDAWQFPIGTRLWKEFAFQRRVETRYMERTVDGWRFATYAWNDAESEATLAPSDGVRRSAPITPTVQHQLPSVADCGVCHGSGPSPVLGFTSLQLSPDRDPGAVHRELVVPGSIDLSTLVTSGLLRGYRGAPRPRIAARTSTERSALGYLHSNCGGCHRPDGPVGAIGMVLATSSVATADRQPAKLTAIGQVSRFSAAGATFRIVPGDPEHSLVLARMRSRAPLVQMPPLATQLVDEQAVQLIARWIEQLSEPITHQQGEFETCLESQ